MSINDRNGQSPYQDFGYQRVWPKHYPNFKGWNFQAQREFPAKFELSKLSRENASRKIGRTPEGTKRATSVNMQLLRLRRDPRTGSISKDVANCSLRALQGAEVACIMGVAGLVPPEHGDRRVYQLWCAMIDYYYTYINTWTCVYMYIYIYTEREMCIYVYTYTCAYTYMYIYASIIRLITIMILHVYIYIYIYMYICMSVYIYIYMYMYYIIYICVRLGDN